MHKLAKKNLTYSAYIRFKISVIILLGIICIFAAFVAIAAGSAGLSPKEVALTLIGHGTKQSETVIFNIRLPRVVTAIVAGIGLATTGCAMQSLLRNPLASASTLGVSQGAAFGASFAIVVLGAGVQSQTLDGVTIMNPYLVSICAFVCSMLSTLVVLGLSRFKKITPEAMVLSGVALSALFSGGTTLMQYFADDVKVAAVVFWTFGDLGRASWREVTIMAIVTLISFVYFMFNRWNYNAMQSGENTAKGLGVNVDSMRIVGMVICSFTASVIVSFVGIINFIGLISPHVMRRIIGGDHRYLLPASALAGALMLLLSDTLARLAVAPVILPIGAITSFLGAPLFLYLLFKGVARK
ncbi:MAG: iron ABC transporter permease [Clostridiales bacterium]|jgi:iron complex transport system permease protein|nr:iron ABC transporter permease [Clostridiales bacterium]